MQDGALGRLVPFRVSPRHRRRSGLWLANLQACRKAGLVATLSAMALMVLKAILVLRPDGTKPSASLLGPARRCRAGDARPHMSLYGPLPSERVAPCCLAPRLEFGMGPTAPN